MPDDFDEMSNNFEFSNPIRPKRYKVEDCKRLCIHSFIRDLPYKERLSALKDETGVHVEPFWGRKHKYITLSYFDVTDDNDPEHLNYKIFITTADCNYGGVRYYFICPLIKSNGKKCKKKVAVLYKSPDSHYFGCRECHQLTYESKSRKYPLPFQPYELMEKDRNFKYKSYNGFHTKRYNSFLEKAGKSYLEFQEKISAMNKKRRLKYLPQK